ncbi:restriction endonuclease subunit S [Vagococcus lutrae]|uniref:restriction endonuclease subunit S n=1 Tax=Vagococcus lutrae TaxID=81947 RepID=UPI00288EC32A|nr:restriction endonuclease subunit S [Vagococcus lutrae]MDT2812638.1 restriction endonuclease subunit S [Vagococcus lutrae]
MKYRFDEIAINSTEKKKPVEEDKNYYLGLEHLDPKQLKVTRYGSEVAPIGEKLIMKKGDVLFGKRRAYQKKVAIAPFDGIFSAHGMVLRPNEEVISKELFPFFISSDYFLDNAIRISVGSLSPTINWGDLRKLEFSLPDKNEQDKIAEVLWAIEENIESYKKLLLATEELIETRFNEMFINRTYKKIELQELYNLQMGKTPSRSVNKYWDSGKHKWITISDMEEGKYHIEDTKEKITDIAVEESGIKVVPADTVIMSFKLSIGRTVITTEDIYTNEAIMAFIAKEGIKVKNKYLMYFLQTRNWDEEVKQAVKGKTLNKGSISKVKVIVPPEELQDDFIIFAEQIEICVREIEDSTIKLQNLKNAIIKKYFG